MITHPALLAAALVALVAGVRWAARQPALARAFAVTPEPFWCYVLPMLGTALGLWPSHSPLYPTLSGALLPVCLGLLLLGTDLPAIARLSRTALIVMLAGSAGIMLGMVTAARLWARWLPPDAWQGLGALAGSWTGGSMNLLAVKEALGAPDAVIAPIIVTDTVVAYGWMAVLLIFAGRRVLPSGEAAGDAGRRPCRAQVVTSTARWPAAGPAASLGLTILLAWGAQWVGQRLPVLSGITAATWTVLLVTTTALLLSATPLGRLGRAPGVSSLGMFLLLVLLASIGARVHPQAFRQAPVFVAAGVTAVAIHGAVLLGVGRWLKPPRGLLATASQANIGGVVSAPLVGAAYDPGLASLGLLMAVLGNALGTYAGLATAALCR